MKSDPDNGRVAPKKSTAKPTTNLIQEQEKVALSKVNGSSPTIQQSNTPPNYVTTKPTTNLI